MRLDLFGIAWQLLSIGELNILFKMIEMVRI